MVLLFSQFDISELHGSKTSSRKYQQKALGLLEADRPSYRFPSFGPV